MENRRFIWTFRGRSLEPSVSRLNVMFNVLDHTTPPRGL